MTKILLLNTPFGACAADWPPSAISRVIEGLDPALRTEVLFLDIDYTRLSLEQIRDAAAKFSPDIIGISAILTPAYKYVKALSLYLKTEFPGVIQVLGGDMAVIANILLHKTKIDFCVIGEAEPTFSRLIAELERSAFRIDDKRPFMEIKELVFLLDGYAHFTGYDKDKRPEVRQVNYALLEKYTSMDQYVQPVDGQFFRTHINKRHLPQFYSKFFPGNIEKKMISVFASQGCVGRCTYCHRYYKGYSVIAPSLVINTIEELCGKYDIGMIQFMGESFGGDKKATKPIIDYLAKKKLNWSAPAVRAKTINEESIRDWKAAGCIQLGFGIESCSEKILKVMEKRMTVEDNLNAIRLCAKYDIYGQIDLVIGLPGETNETIQETIDALATVLPDTLGTPYELSTAWFMAIPGTPGYEFARAVGRIGPSLDDEERYMLGLHDINANSEQHYLNFTDYEKEEILYWKDYIFFELNAAYMNKHGRLNVLRVCKAPRFKYTTVYMLFPKAVRRCLLRYFSIVRYYGALHLAGFLLKKPFVRRGDYFRNINASLRTLLKTMVLPVRDDDKFTCALREGR